MTFEKLSNKPLAWQIIDQISNAIRAGDYNAGDQLPPERDLAEMFGVSRLTIRHAFSILAAYGILERRQGSGTYVRSNSFLPNFIELFPELFKLEEYNENALAARMILEPAIAAAAAKAARPEDLRELREVFNRMEDACKRNVHSGHEELEFHLYSARIVNNPFIDTFASIMIGAWFGDHNLWMKAMEPTLADPRLLETYLNLHEEILLSIESKDSERAEKAALDHILQTRSDWLTRTKS